MQRMRIPPYVVVIPALGVAAAHAEGIALGNPLIGASFTLFGLPLVGSAALLLGMALTKGLRKPLLVALLLCGIFAMTLVLVGSGGMSGGVDVLWLVGLILSPWVCFVILQPPSSWADA